MDLQLFDANPWNQQLDIALDVLGSSRRCLGSFGKRLQGLQQAPGSSRTAPEGSGRLRDVKSNKNLMFFMGLLGDPKAEGTCSVGGNSTVPGPPKHQNRKAHGLEATQEQGRYADWMFCTLSTVDARQKSFTAWWPRRGPADDGKRALARERCSKCPNKIRRIHREGVWGREPVGIFPGSEAGG